jgi:hypothetical protein
MLQALHQMPPECHQWTPEHKESAHRALATLATQCNVIHNDVRARNFGLLPTETGTPSTVVVFDLEDCTITHSEKKKAKYLAMCREVIFYVPEKGREEEDDENQNEVLKGDDTLCVEEGDNV